MNKWNSKRIAFVSILIAMSISFVVIGAQAFALSSLPSVKLSLVGLPVKIVGFLFGPITGLLVGMATDLLSFVFVPIFYYPMYSLALGISGMLPGVSATFFNYFYERTKKENHINNLRNKKILNLFSLKEATLNNQVNKVYKLERKISFLDEKIEQTKKWDKEYLQIKFALYSGISMVFIALIALTFITFYVLPQSSIDSFVDSKHLPTFLKKKINYLTLIWLGVGSSVILVIIGRFKMKQETFLRFVPILLFVVLTEYINLPIIAYADEKTINVEFIVSYVSSLLTSPIKIWMNLIIISFAIKIVLPLIKKKSFNGYA